MVFMITAAALRYYSYRNQVTLPTEDRTRFGHKRLNEQDLLIFLPVTHSTTPQPHCALLLYASCYLCTSAPEGGNQPDCGGGRQKPTASFDPVSSAPSQVFRDNKMDVFCA